MRKLTLIGLTLVAATGLAACEQAEAPAETETTTEVPAEEAAPAEGAMEATPAEGAAPAEGAMEAPADATATPAGPEGGAPSSGGTRTTPPGP